MGSKKQIGLFDCQPQHGLPGSYLGMVAGFLMVRSAASPFASRWITGTFLRRIDCGQEKEDREEEGGQEGCQEEERQEEGRQEGRSQEGQAEDQESLVVAASKCRGERRVSQENRRGSELTRKSRRDAPGGSVCFIAIWGEGVRSMFSVNAGRSKSWPVGRKMDQTPAS